jgi:4-aminobutyrate aminotransferase-like enzyme
MAPPLLVSDAEIDQALEVFAEAVGEVFAGRSGA